MQIGTSLCLSGVLALRASRDSGVGEIDFFLMGKAAKICYKREGQNWCHIYNRTATCLYFFSSLHCSISEIGLIIIAGLQPGFPSNSSRDNLCLLLPVTWSMTNGRPLSIKFFFEHFQTVRLV